METITGTFSTARVFSETAEQYALAQVKAICDNEVSANSRICVMPDVHPGKVAPIGLTMTIGKRILPYLVGIDIGCGMTTARISKHRGLEFKKLDTVIRERVPSGFEMQKSPHRFSDDFDFSRLECVAHVYKEKAALSLGTLGGGNHFIEIDRTDDGNNYLIIHTGSRNLGKQVAELYQALAVDLAKGKEELFKEQERIITEYKAAGRRKEIQATLIELRKNFATKNPDIPADLCHVYGKYFQEYLHDLAYCQEFARKNRETMAKILLQRTGITGGKGFHTIHNYIDVEEKILRKGAIAAHKGEVVLIPINMRDGSVLAVGKGNADWNFSAPHGAGRLLSRTQAKEQLNLDEFQKTMSDVYTTSVNEFTLDESPMAYKSLDDIIDVIDDTVDIIDVMKPVYNFKAG